MRRAAALAALAFALARCSGGGSPSDPCAGVSCDDENPCTDDACEQGACAHAANAAPCDDGDPCTAGDACDGGACAGGGPTECPAPPNAQCWEAPSCDPGVGCVQQRKAPGAPCDDGNACTGRDACAADGTCAGETTACVHAGNPACWVALSCDPATGCAFRPADAGVPCDDGDACTSGEACDGAGLCAGGAGVTCPPAAACHVATCDPATGCTATLAEAGTPCTADGNVCTADVCDATGSCTHAPGGGACDDGLFCTTGDACSGGTCAGTGGRDCDDGKACTVDACDAGLQACTSTPVDAACDDGNPCTDDACEPVAGDPTTGCTHRANAAACDDGNACTTADTCSAGACVGGTARSCDDGNPCTTDACDVAKGCTFTPAPNATPCNDGNACTAADACSGGVCTGSPRSCNDSNPCTDDACDSSRGCTYTANAAPCDDANACTAGDTCSGGTCAAGAPVTCDDGIACTADACAASTGCAHTPEDAACDDANPCTADTCDPGSGGCRHVAIACTATLYEIRTGTIPAGSLVDVYGVVVTARTRSTLWVQDPAAATFGAVSLYFGTAPPLSVGALVNVSGTVAEFFGATQLSAPVVDPIATVVPPVPILVDPARVATGGPDAEAYESMLVRVESVAATVAVDAFDEYQVTGGLRVDDLIIDGGFVDGFPSYAVGTAFASIAGILHSVSAVTKLEPRTAADVVTAP